MSDLKTEIADIEKILAAKKQELASIEALTRQEAVKNLASIVDNIKTNIVEARDFAKEHGLTFTISIPPTKGGYRGAGEIEFDGYDFSPAGGWYSSSMDC